MYMSKNIIAFFKTPEEANSVADQLKSMGVEDLKVERFSKFAGDGTDQIRNPITGKISSLANLTAGADVDGPNSGILAAADISASGLSDGGDGVSGRDVLLSAVVDECVGIGR